VIFAIGSGLKPDRLQPTTEATSMSGNRYRPLFGLLASCLGLVALLALPSGAAARDRNHDRIPDRWEKAHHLSLKANQARRDQDSDGLGNRGEFQASDKPHDPDTDNDGTEDGDENAGTIERFNAETGRLVINLFGGDTLSGQVTDQTEIECENENENEGNDDDNQVNDRHGDNSGPGSENSGPGNSGDDENSGPGNDNDNEGNCTTADLTPTRVVQEAELHTEGGTAVFEKVELG
jgi:hypothetical protein